MFKQSISKKFAAVALGTAVTVGSLGVAFAWWSTTGDGFGEGSTTAGVTDVLTFDTAELSAMYPGDASQPLTVTVTNTDANESVYVDEVNAWITTNNLGCDGDDFLLNGVAAPSSNDGTTALNWTATDMAAGQDEVSSNTIQFNNKAVDQDACKGATVTVHYDVPAADDAPVED